MRWARSFELPSLRACYSAQLSSTRYESTIRVRDSLNEYVRGSPGSRFCRQVPHPLLLPALLGPFLLLQPVNRDGPRVAGGAIKTGDVARAVTMLVHLAGCAHLLDQGLQQPNSSE